MTISGCFFFPIQKQCLQPTMAVILSFVNSKKPVLIYNYLHCILIYTVYPLSLCGDFALWMCCPNRTLESLAFSRFLYKLNLNKPIKTCLPKGEGAVRPIKNKAVRPIKNKATIYLAIFMVPSKD